MTTSHYHVDYILVGGRVVGEREEENRTFARHSVYETVKEIPVDTSIKRSMLKIKNIIVAVAMLLVISFGNSTHAAAQELKQTDLEIGTILRPPFVMKSSDGTLSGFSIELWNLINADLGVTTTFQEFDVFSDMLDTVQSGELDAAIANISITFEREQVMDFSQPIYDSGLQVVAAVTDTKPNFLRLIWDSGIIFFIGIALGVLLIIAHILWFFERDVADSRHDYFRDDYRKGVWDAFWWAFIIMTMGGFEKEVPHKILSRIIAMTWIVASLFFISTLTAKITTALTVSQLQSDIKSYKDLAGKRVGIPESPVASNFLTQEGITFRQFSSLENLQQALETGELDAIVHDAPIMQYYVKHNGSGKVRLAGEVFQPDFYGVLLPEESELKEYVDQSLIKFKQDGRYQELRKKYFGE